MTVSFFYKSSCWTCILLGWATTTWAEPCLSKLSKQGEKLFSERLYSDAIPFYTHALSCTEDEKTKLQLAKRLATCFIKEGNPQNALTLLSSFSPLQENHNLYMMSLVYRHLGKPQEALEILNRCAPVSEHSDEKTMISLEKGYHLFHLGDWQKAELVFASIPLVINNSLPYSLAQIYLAKIHLMKHEYDAGLKKLESLAGLLSENHPLNLERIFLTGWLQLARQRNLEASQCFESLLSSVIAPNSSWSIEALQGLIISLLNQALATDLPEKQILSLIAKAEKNSKELLFQAPTETSYLLMCDLYLVKAKTLKDPLAYIQAQKLLEKPDLFSSEEGLRQAMIKTAEAAPTDQERSALYDRLSSDEMTPPAFRAKAYFLKGLNDFDQGLKYANSQELKQAHIKFDQAAQAFHKAALLATPSQLRLSALATKHEALACTHQPEEDKVKQAWKIILELISNPVLYSALDNPQEVYPLAGWIALHAKDKKVLQQARLFLKQGQNEPSSPWAEQCLKLEGLICLQLENWQEADSIFSKFLSIYASSSLGEIWFWKAYCADQLQNASLKKEYLQNAYTQDPLSPYAPIAYFHYYSYRDYMHGNRKTIKHLQSMPLLFPSHPLLINAHYLIGLSQKKDLFSDEGQLIRRKDLTAAIEAFQTAESTFESLFKKNLIPPKDLLHYLQIRTLSQLERGQANFAIAKASKGGKRQIYLEYSESVFMDLIQEFLDTDSLIKRHLISDSALYPRSWAEAELQLAQLYEEREWHDKAEEILNRCLEHYQKAQISLSKGLINVWIEKGKIAQKQKRYQEALCDFIEAEKASGQVSLMSPHEKLDLWIQQSICYQSLNELDQAMQLLSQVINDDVISPLRIKAMVLRAEIYETQERPELAIKQLEAASLKGGEWGHKAKEKLENKYGYQ